MKHQVKLINRLSRAITCFLFLALLPIGVTLGSNPAEAQLVAYITNFGDGIGTTVSVINTADTNDVTTVTVGIGPFGVAVNPAGSRVYITNLFDGIVSGTGTVSVINTASNSVIATVQVGSMPFGVAVNPAGTFVYVANFLGDGINPGGTVSVIDTGLINTPMDPVIATVQVGIGPFGVAVNPAGTFVYVTNFLDGTVSVIDTGLINTPMDPVIGTVPVGIGPTGVAVNPAGSRVYVANQGDIPNSLPGTTVSVINTTDNSVTSVDVGSGPTGVAVHPAGSSVYVANQGSNTVSVINTTDNSVTSVDVGSTPIGVAVHPTEPFVYVANTSSDTVSVINTANNNSVTSVTVGDAPVAFGQFIGPGAVSAIVGFAALNNAKAEIELGPLANDDEFEVKATFTLGAGSNGIYPLTEIVGLELSGGSATFSTTIPVGSFEFRPAKPGKNGKPGKPAHFKFEGVINGVSLEVKITPLSANTFEFKAEGEGANLAGTVNPVEVGLIIGDDGGSITVTAKFE